MSPAIFHLSPIFSCQMEAPFSLLSSLFMHILCAFFARESCSFLHFLFATGCQDHLEVFYKRKNRFELVLHSPFFRGSGIDGYVFSSHVTAILLDKWCVNLRFYGAAESCTCWTNDIPRPGKNIFRSSSLANRQENKKVIFKAKMLVKFTGGLAFLKK